MQYVAFLRGMNLGGRRIKNPELCACFEALGCTAVSAFLASGNVIFKAEGDAAAVTARLEAGLAAQLGYPVPTLVRTAAEVIAVADHAPFADRPSAPRGKVQVMFVRDARDEAAIRALETADDWLEVGDRLVYWWPAGQMSASEFEIKAVERITGTATVRTRNTVERLAAKHLRG